MKIVKVSAKFEPVTLTLESQEELDAFAEVFYRVGGAKMVEVFGHANYVYQLLEQSGGVVDDTGMSFGSITVS